MTIVEVLVASAVTAAVSAAALAGLTAAQALGSREAERADAVQRLRFAADVLTREIREATLVTAGGDAGAISIRRGAVRRDYYFDGERGQLRQAQDGVDFPVVDSVEDLRFEPAPGLVRVRIVLGARVDRVAAAWTVALRNPP